MAFKLKSGNSPMFKRVGEEKETIEQYNAKVRAEYEAKLQAHSDSTASYNQGLNVNNLRLAQIERGKELAEIASKRRSGLQEGYENELRGGTNFDDDYYDAEELKNSFSEVKKATGDLRAAAESLRETGIYPKSYDRPGHGVVGRVDAESLNPGLAPRKPIEKMTRVELKNIDMEQTAPSVIEPSKRKYMTSDDGKYKYNLETGERSKVNTQEVKNTRRPGKRSVKNLVTGKNNRVQ